LDLVSAFFSATVQANNFHGSIILLSQVSKTSAQVAFGQVRSEVSFKHRHFSASVAPLDGMKRKVHDVLQAVGGDPFTMGQTRSRVWSSLSLTVHHVINPDLGSGLLIVAF
jgi:hypothetical protein